jgi:hypothetical protein
MSSERGAMIFRHQFDGYREDEMLATPEIPGAFEAVARLAGLFGPENVWLVSKAGPRTEERTLRWLTHHEFCGRTGIDVRHICFCRDWAGKQDICSFLGISYFVDDHPEVATALDGTVAYRYLFGPQTRNIPTLDSWIETIGAIPVADWPAAERAIRANFILTRES